MAKILNDDSIDWIGSADKPGFEKFEDENFKVKHTSGGLLSMANAGPGTNGSQFFVTSLATPHLDNKHVVFGKLIHGWETTFKTIEGQKKAPGGDKPLAPVVIEDCGIWDSSMGTEPNSK